METKFGPIGALAAIAMVVGVGLAACGSEAQPPPPGRAVDPGAFLASLEGALCDAASLCAGAEGQPALAGCGFAVGFDDVAACRTWVRQRSVGLSAALASGQLCYYGAPRDFTGTNLATACLDSLAAFEANEASCVAGEAAVTSCEGAVQPGGEAGAGGEGKAGAGGEGEAGAGGEGEAGAGGEGEAGAGGEGEAGAGGEGEAGAGGDVEIMDALVLPLPCRCVFLPLGELPEDCQAALLATDLGARPDLIGDGQSCDPID